MIILILLLCNFFAATVIFYDATKGKKKKQVKAPANTKYKMPPIFSDEFNWLSLKIYHMKIEEADTVQARINEFIYKYEQFIDFQVFNDRVGILLSDYQKKVKSLLNNKHLEHGTSV